MIECFLAMRPTAAVSDLLTAVRRTFAETPLVGVVRTSSSAEAERQARLFIAGGIELVEVTFTVPEAPALVRRLLAERDAGEVHRVGMGTVTGPGRAHAALDAGAEFIVTPNASPEVAATVRAAEVFLVMGGLTPTEIVTARDLGADLVKVFPVPLLGGPAYLRAVRGPLSDIPMLASGGFGPEEIPAYREAGASAFGIGAPLLAGSDAETLRRIGGAVALARGGGSGEGAR